MSELLQHWAGQLDRFATSPDFVERKAAMDQALAFDLPHGRVEDWKYTPLRAYARRQADIATTVPTVDPAILAGLPSPRIVFINGIYSADTSDMTAAAGITAEFRESTLTFQGTGPAQVLNQINTALNQGGIDIHLSGDTHATLHLVWLSTPEQPLASVHNTHTVQVAPGARATLIEHVIAQGAHQHVSTNRIRVHVDHDATLHHFRAQLDDSGATWFARTEVSLAADSLYKRLDLELGSALSRHELQIDLSGDNAFAQCNGILLGDGKRHLDTRLNIAHRGLHTGCDLVWRGLGTERSKIAFHGGIYIHQGADFTKASLSNKNLLLSENAEIDTQPVLEIYADEVEAAHGATVGQLDPNSLFYLRSRGIDDRTARTLLIAAFVHELLAVIPDNTLRREFATHLDKSLLAVDF